MAEPRAGWFELFFDLVFVVIVSTLAHGIHGASGVSDFGVFLVLFFPAWWAWVNLMVSVNILGPTSRRAQAMLVAAMPGLGLLAAAAPEGLGGRAWAYALGAAWVRLVSFGAWVLEARRPGSRLSLWRPLLYCLVPAVLWAVSAAVPGSGRFVLWAVAVALEVFLLAVRSEDASVYTRLSTEHMAERVSLFVVVVLGESVFTLAAALADHFTAASAVAALLGFLTVAQLAGVFFLWGTTGVARGLGRAQAGRSHRVIRDSVMYLPFLLVCGMTAVAAALGTAVDHPGHVLPPGARWALCGGVLAFYTANAAISLRYGDPARLVARWYAPALLLPLGVLVPAGALLPAWAAVGCSSLVVLLLAVLARFHRRTVGATSAG